MVTFFDELFLSLNLGESFSKGLAYFIGLSIIIAIAILSRIGLRKLILRPLRAIVKKTPNIWDNAFVKRKVLDRLSYFLPVVIIYATSNQFPDIQEIIQKTTLSIIWFLVAFVLSSIMDSINEIYSGFKISATRPIKGLVQILKIIAYIVSFIMIFSTITGTSPLGVLTAIGALTAVLLIVFKDTLLAIVASFQITTDNLVSIGDWISVPQYNADGEVIDISLHIVKVKNWDKTITTIPIYSLVTNSFKNYKSMVLSGGRRIKRSVLIDMKSIRFLNESDIEKFKKIQLIKKYIEDKTSEIDEYNRENHIDISTPVNGRKLTNIGTLRIYTLEYLKNNNHIRKDLTYMVRQLDPTELGLPLEIYAFSNDTNWVNYENIQSDIFDHILAIIPQFGLRVFQNPSGYDFDKFFIKDEHVN